MADVHDVETRRRNMSAIKDKNTKPELIIRKLCHAEGFRYRLHRKSLPGKPDLVFPKYRAAILVHGCFWHGHDCELFTLPSTRTGFWGDKIAGNTARDKYQLAQLLDLGWRVMVVWECALKGKSRLGHDSLAAELTAWLKSSQQIGELRGDQLGNRPADIAAHDA